MAVVGTTTQRGYGYHHQQARHDALRDLIDGDPCHHCGQPMHHTQQLDLDHTPDRTAYLGLAHRACNRSEGATRGNRTRGHTPHSRDW